MVGTKATDQRDFSRERRDSVVRRATESKLSFTIDFYVGKRRTAKQILSNVSGTIRGGRECFDFVFFANSKHQLVSHIYSLTVFDLQM